MARGTNIEELRPDIVKFVGGGKTRTIQYDLNSFAELEKKYGSVEAAMQELQKGGMKAVRTILWAGLIHEEAILDEDGEPVAYNITPYQVGSWVKPSQMPEISKLIERAMEASMPTPDKPTEVADDKVVPMTTPEGHTIATIDEPTKPTKN